MKAQTEALRATLNQDPAIQRGCTCLTRDRVTGQPRRASFEECGCEWGVLTRNMLYLGYAATTMEAIHSLAALGGNVNMAATRRRRQILQDALDAWPAGQSITAFLAAHNITRAKYDDIGLKRRH